MSLFFTLILVNIIILSIVLISLNLIAVVISILIWGAEFYLLKNRAKFNSSRDNSLPTEIK